MGRRHALPTCGLACAKLEVQPRNSMNKLALALLVTAAPFLVADELPKADTILDRFLNAVGGKAAFEKHHNEVMHGNLEFTGRGLKGTLTVYQAEPDQVRAIIDIESVGKVDSGTD